MNNRKTNNDGLWSLIGIGAMILGALYGVYLTFIAFFMSLGMSPLSFPMNSFAGNNATKYWSCILDEMPGVTNNIAAHAVQRSCHTKYPPKGAVETRSPWFGVKTTDECTTKYARNTAGSSAPSFIFQACSKLYKKRRDANPFSDPNFGAEVSSPNSKNPFSNSDFDINSARVDE